MKTSIVIGWIGLASLMAFVSPRSATNDEIRKRGDAITQVSGQVLSKAVMQAMGQGGVAHAATFCNTRAYPITDSLAKAHSVTIKRTAIRWRNPKNKPNKLERKLWGEFELDQKNGKPLEAKVVALGKDEWLYARPILLQAPCQVCHGKLGETLTAENYATIKTLYPKDKATGFTTGDLRGLWVLKFKH